MDIILIGFQNEENLRKNHVKWSGNYFADIVNVTPADIFGSGCIKRGFAYYSPYSMRDKKCVELKIKEITISEKSLSIQYEPQQEQGLDSGTAYRAIRKMMSENENGVNNFPFCICTDAGMLNTFTEEENLVRKINYHKSQNNWLLLYNLFAPIEKLKERNHIWNNDSILDSIAFAAAKLSEVYINLKQVYPDARQRDAFLAIQRKYRKETIMLRERCIELNPGKASYHSNLAYSYYQFIRELTVRGGRRDDSIERCIALCLGHLDTALSIDPARITDHYRRGRVKLLSAKRIFPGGNGTKNIDKRGLFREAIDSFQEAEKFYELMPVIEDKSFDRYKKEYLKSLYCIASSYSELLYDDWDYAKYFIAYEDDTDLEVPDERLTVSNRALHYIEKCILKDSGLKEERKSYKETIDIAGHDGQICGVYKLYAAGKYYFQRYWYLSKCGNPETAESLDARIVAEEYLSKALKRKFPEELSRQGKGFIAERLSRLYIAKGEFAKAAEVLKPFVRERTDYYIRYTYATALKGCGDFEGAMAQLKCSLADTSGNKSEWMGWFLKSCIEVSRGELKAASESMGNAVIMAQKVGKRNLDSLYISRAFICYRMGCSSEMMQHLETALRLNPRRESLKKRHKMWKSGLENFDLCKLA